MNTEVTDVAKAELEKRAVERAAKPKKSKAQKQAEHAAAVKGLTVVDGGGGTDPVKAGEVVPLKKDGETPSNAPVGKEPGTKRKRVEGKKRPPSANVVKYLAQPAFKHEQIITQVVKGSKTRKAAERFKLYKEGMTVGEYLKVMSGWTEPRTAGQTMNDVRWDHVCGFIKVK